MRNAIPRRGHGPGLSVLAVMSLVALAGMAHAGSSGDFEVANAEATHPEGSPIKSPAEARHPLAAAHPDDDVVVCEAGCRGDGPEIVYLEPRAGAVNPVSNAIECVAGCYDTPKAYEAVDAVSGGEGSATVTLEQTPAESTTMKREPFSPVR